MACLSFHIHLQSGLPHTSEVPEHPSPTEINAFVPSNLPQGGFVQLQSFFTPHTAEA